MTTLFKYQVYLNNTTAYIWLNSTPDEKGRIDWTIELASDDSKVLYSSKLIITPKQGLPSKPDEPIQRQTATPKDDTECPVNDAEITIFRQRLIASRLEVDEDEKDKEEVQEEEVQEEEEEMFAYPDRWCILPVNQPIYQALMDKAASYSPDKVWQTRAYRNAAQGILTYNFNIFDINNFMNWRCSRGIGSSIDTFVGNFIKDFKHLPDVLNYLE